MLNFLALSLSLTCSETLMVSTQMPTIFSNKELYDPDFSLLSSFTDRFPQFNAYQNSIPTNFQDQRAHRGTEFIIVEGLHPIRLPTIKRPSGRDSTTE